MAYVDDDDDPVWDLYELPESIHRLPDKQLDVSLPCKSVEASTDPSSKDDFDEESRIKALVNTPALDWQQPSSSFGCASGRGMRGGRMVGGRGFGRGSGLQWRRPPEGYVCRRCNVAGHLIQHCPTNGDPNFDFKTMKNPTGLPKSRLIPNPDGSYALPSGDVAVFRPDEAAFEREVEGMPSTRRLVGDVPKELYCQLCKQIMKFAVLSSKCCFQSFCDECIRKFIISKSMCVCGATDILADDLLPNLTLRKTINRIMESNEGSSVENDVSALRVQDVLSTNLHAKVPSPVQSVDEPIAFTKPARAERVIWAGREEVAKEGLTSNDRITDDSIVVKEPEPQGGSMPLADEEFEGAQMPLDSAEMQRNAAQNLSVENQRMPPMAFDVHNPYWTTGIQFGMEGFLTPYAGAFPYTGFGFSAFGMPFEGTLPRDPFAGSPSMNRSRVEFEAGKSVFKKKRGAGRTKSLEDQELENDASSSSNISSTNSFSVVPSRSSSHRSKRSFPDCQEYDYHDYDRPRRKQPRRHGDEHYHYQDERHHQHHREHHQRSRHLH